MRKPAKHLLTAAGALALVLSGASLLPQAALAAEEAKAKTPAQEGKDISFDRVKGNCLACHIMAGGDLMGNVGPALVNMKARYPDKAQLRAQIWDATVKNPNTIMPPFGRHKMLSEEEIDKVVEFVYGL